MKHTWLDAWVVCGIALFLRSACGAELPQWDMAAITELRAPWGPLAKDGEISFRAIKGKSPQQPGRWIVPAWWGEGRRPLHGTVYILEVLYKDVLSSPAIFYTHSALLHSNYSEVHRFGGTGDQKWKTANIPVSWDLICKVENEENTGLAVSTGGAELPVSKILVRLVGKDDAEHFFQETRSWVADLKWKTLQDFKLVAGSNAAIAENLKDQLLVPFVRPYINNILQDSVPQQGETGVPIKIRMTLDEYEPAAFGVYANGINLKAVTYELSDLTGPQGKLACKVDLRTAEYVPSEDKKTKKLEVLPFRLWPKYAVDIPTGFSHGFWITLKTSPGISKAGTYKGTITICSEQEKALLPVEVEVLPIQLLSVDEIGVPVGGCVASFPPEQEMETYREHNQRALHVFYGGIPLPQMQLVEGKLNLNFTVLDEWMAMATANGLTDFMWFLGGDPYIYPDCLNLELRLYRMTLPKQESGQYREKFVSKYQNIENKGAILPEILPLYTQWVQQIAARAREKKWPRLILHPFDEPTKFSQRQKQEDNVPILGSGPWIKDHFREVAALMHAASKDILVGGDMTSAREGLAILDDVDVFCTNAARQDPELGNKVRAGKKAFWQYSGTNARQAASTPRYTFGFFFGAYGSTGGLQWAMTFSKGFEYPTAAGDAMYSWYTPFGTIVAPAYEGLREGMDDRRLIETYKQKFAKDSVAMEKIKKMLDEAIQRRASAGSKDTVNNFFAAIDNVTVLDTWRNQLLDDLVSNAAPTK